MNPGVVGLELAACPRHRRAVQALLELVVAERLRHGPVDAGGAREQQELADRALADADRTGNLGVAQPGFEVQAQGLSYLTHCDPGGGHGGPAKPASMPAGKITRAFRQSSTIRLKRCPRSA
jgi:hypothetical protein